MLFIVLLFLLFLFYCFYFMILEINLKIISINLLGILSVMEYLYRTLPNDVFQNKLVNKAFSSLGVHELFTGNSDWYLTKNEIDHICYTKRGHETDCFEIIIQRDKIYICVPIKNSIFQFKTSFKDYTRAFDYLEKRFYDFNEYNEEC